MPSRGSFLKWSLILTHLQNYHPRDELHEGLRLNPGRLFCLFQEYFCYFGQNCRLVIQLKACLLVISSGAFSCHFERSPEGEVEKSARRQGKVGKTPLQVG